MAKETVNNEIRFDTANLAYVLLSRGILTSRDINFITNKESFESWKAYNDKYAEQIMSSSIHKTSRGWIQEMIDEALQENGGEHAL